MRESATNDVATRAHEGYPDGTCVRLPISTEALLGRLGVPNGASLRTVFLDVLPRAPWARQLG